MGDLYTKSKPATAAVITDGETMALVHSIALLVECLDKAGLISFEDYRTKLMALWNELPPDDNSGASAVFDQLSTLIAEAITKRPFRPTSSRAPAA